LELWLREKTSRVSHKEHHRKCHTQSAVTIDSSEDEPEVFCLNDWEKWVGSRDDCDEIDDDDLEVIE